MEDVPKSIYSPASRIPPGEVHAEFSLERPRPGVSAWREGKKLQVGPEQQIIDICSYYERRCAGRQEKTSLAARMLFQMSREVQGVLRASTGIDINTGIGGGSARGGSLSPRGSQNKRHNAEASAAAMQRSVGISTMRKQRQANAKHSRAMKEAEDTHSALGEELAACRAEMVAKQAAHDAEIAALRKTMEDHHHARRTSHLGDMQRLAAERETMGSELRDALEAKVAAARAERDAARDAERLNAAATASAQAERDAAFASRAEALALLKQATAELAKIKTTGATWGRFSRGSKSSGGSGSESGDESSRSPTSRGRKLGGVGSNFSSLPSNGAKGLRAPLSPIRASSRSPTNAGGEQRRSAWQQSESGSASGAGGPSPSDGEVRVAAALRDEVAQLRALVAALRESLRVQNECDAVPALLSQRWP
tara:strand:+ start:79 stop:1353 length:1275 start_codon:yes stop_codon:yes gene_type:complete